MKKIIPITLALIFSASCAYAIVENSSSSESSKDKIIYLTFDDGPNNATRGVVDILNKHDIKATFLINGVHLFGQGNENENMALDGLMYAFKTGQVIGNHSYEHMLKQHVCGKGDNQIPGGEKGAFYQKYCSSIDVVRAYFNPEVDYTSFIPLNTYGIRDVLYDKEYQQKYGMENMPMKKGPARYGKLYANDDLDTMARLPFTNNWRVNWSPRDRDYGVSRHHDRNYMYYDMTNSRGTANSRENSFKLSDKLAEYGMNVYGWDIDWGPTQYEGDSQIETMMRAEALEAATEAAFKNCPSDVSELCKGSNYEMHKNKVVILTHDFLFEGSNEKKGPRGNGQISRDTLDTFINDMKAKGYKFDTLDHYPE